MSNFKREAAHKRILSCKSPEPSTGEDKLSSSTIEPETSMQWSVSSEALALRACGGWNFGDINVGFHMLEAFANAGSIQQSEAGGSARFGIVMQWQ